MPSASGWQRPAPTVDSHHLDICHAWHTAMNAHLKYAFEDLNINRFWLDVFPDNTAGIGLYESLKMHKDGILRQNYKADRGYLDQIIYSMLKSEYFKP